MMRNTVSCITLQYTRRRWIPEPCGRLVRASAPPHVAHVATPAGSVGLVTATRVELALQDLDDRG